jgi:hypothetical protein
MGDILAFHRYRCVLCDRPFDVTHVPRFSERDRLNGWGCACRQRKLSLVADFLPVPNVLSMQPTAKE